MQRAPSVPSSIRVAIAGATGYAGQELLRLLARHPGVRLTAAMSSGGETRRLPALARIWDGEVQPLDLEALCRESDVVFLGLPEAAAARVGAALVGARHPRDRSLGRVPPARRRAPQAVVPGHGRAARGHALRPAGAEPRRSCPAPGWCRARAATRPPPCSRCSRSRTPALIEGDVIIDAKSGVSGAGKAATDRTHFSENHGSVAAYGVFGHRHAAEMEQELERAGHVRPAPRPAQPRHPRDDLRARQARHDSRGRRHDHARRLRGRAVCAAVGRRSCPRSSTPPTRLSATSGGAWTKPPTASSSSPASTIS